MTWPGPDEAPAGQDRTPRSPQRIGPGYSFRARLTGGILAAGLLPLGGFGLLIVGTQIARTGALDPTTTSLVVFALAASVIIAVVLAYLLAGSLVAPLRAIIASVERVAAGDIGARVEVAGEDELARLVESHNRLAADLARRNEEVGRILVAIGETSPRDGLERLVTHATASAKAAFDMIDCDLHLGDPGAVAVEEAVPGEARPVRAVLALPDERIGVLAGHLPATRSWTPADQDLLDLFASEIAVAIRNVELFEQVERQRERLVALDAAKDDFLRGISHNLQTPLTSIRAYADQLAAEQPDRRLAIIAEQSERLSRMVRQLLAVSRLESGSLRPRSEVLALAPRVRHAWDALGASDTPFRLDDQAPGWLAIADRDQLDQVLWALLDNALKYGRGSAIEAIVSPASGGAALELRIRDRGPGVPEELRERLFERYARGVGGDQPEGTGIGLYVSRELCRAMGGRLELEAGDGGAGATFIISLPAESPAAAEA